MGGGGGHLGKTSARGGSSPKKTPSPIARSGSGREASTATPRARHARATASLTFASVGTERRGTFARASRRGRRWPARISRTHDV